MYQHGWIQIVTFCSVSLGGGEEWILLEFGVCVRENELLRISDFLYCGLLILPIENFTNLQPGVEP